MSQGAGAEAQNRERTAIAAGAPSVRAWARQRQQNSPHQGRAAPQAAAQPCGPHLRHIRLPNRWSRTRPLPANPTCSAAVHPFFLRPLTCAKMDRWQLIADATCTCLQPKLGVFDYVVFCLRA